MKLLRRWSVPHHLESHNALQSYLLVALGKRNGDKIFLASLHLQSVFTFKIEGVVCSTDCKAS